MKPNAAAAVLDIQGIKDNQKNMQDEKKIEEQFKYFYLIILIAGLLLIGLLIYTIRSVVSPVLVFLAIQFLLFPLRSYKHVRTLMWLSGILFAVWFIYELGTILIPFVLSFLLAYILNPLISKFESFKVSRLFASLILILILVGIIALGVVFLLPATLHQFNNMLFVIADIAKDLVTQIKEGKIFAWLSAYGIPVEYSRDVLTQQLTPKLEAIFKNIIGAVLNFISSISNIITQIINALIIPFLTFYLLKDFPQIIEKTKSLIPTDHREKITNYFTRVDTLMGRYLRGALAVAFIHGILAGLLLWIFGIHYPLVLGFIAGTLSLIPYIGLLISLTVALIVSLFSGDPVWLKIVFVLGIFGTLQILEASVLSPNILGRQVGLHPVILVLSLWVFGYFFGFIGLILAIP
ncbi:MAG: AI-2E family transporter, partial [Bacteroidota bacterium]|nr:AI-2E family transporter [Bacteroidota bacterium]